MKLVQRGSLLRGANGAGVPVGSKWIHRAGSAAFCWDGVTQLWATELPSGAVVQPRQLLPSPAGVGVITRLRGKEPAALHCLRPSDGSLVWETALPGRVLERRPGAVALGGDFFVYAFEGNQGALHRIRSESGQVEDLVELAHVTELCMGDEVAWVAGIRGLWACDENLELRQVSTDRAPQYLHAAAGLLAYALRAPGGVELVLIRQDGTPVARRVFKGMRPALYPQILADGDVTIRPEQGIQRWDLVSGNRRWSAISGHATSAAVSVAGGVVALGQPIGDASGHSTNVWLLDIDSGDTLDLCSLPGAFSTVQAWDDGVVVAGLSGLVRLAIQE